MDRSLYFLKLTQKEKGIPRIEQSIAIDDNLSWSFCFCDKRFSLSDQASTSPSSLPVTIK